VFCCQNYLLLETLVASLEPKEVLQAVVKTTTAKDNSTTATIGTSVGKFGTGGARTKRLHHRI
jgi:hypothetical protein